jgi:hypothetical protein
MKTVNNSKKQHSRYGFTTLFPIFSLFGIFALLIAYQFNSLVYAQNEYSQYPYTDILGINDRRLEKSSYKVKLISIKRQNEVRKVLTNKIDIFEILNESGVHIEKNDTVLLNTRYIVNGSIISIVRTETIITQEYEDIPFETEYVKTDIYLKNEQHIIQEGILGIRVRKYINHYEDGFLTRKHELEESIVKEPVIQIIEVGTGEYSITEIVKRGYDCPYWYSVVDNGPYTQEEKRWLKYIMKCESGCNAEHNKSSYKGLFQWSSYWWNKQFSENIFDGHAQIKNTLSKYRAGEATRQNQWPGCHSKYRSTYPL